MARRTLNKNYKERIVLWGCGYNAKIILQNCHIDKYFDVIGIIDNLKEKWDTKLFGYNVLSPDILLSERVDKIIITVDAYDSVKEQIIKNYPDKQYLIDNVQYIYKQEIKNRYNKSDDIEIIEILEYIKSNDLSFFPYAFSKECEYKNIDIRYDKKLQMYYSMHSGKRLYFNRGIKNEEYAEFYYKSLLLEQDYRSPHRYLDDSINVNEGDVIVDCGAAEGIFTLDVIEKVKKAYLFESNVLWIEALRETFKDFQDKVVIIHKYVDSLDFGDSCTIDSVVQENIDFIKMDIEGSEWDALCGAKTVFEKSPNIKCAICSYHRPYDELIIKTLLKEYGLHYSHTKGYIWFADFHDLSMQWDPSYLVRGVVRGRKQ